MMIEQNDETCVAEEIRIAIVDDHAQMREMIASILQRFGFKVVITAQDGSKLIDQLQSIDTLPNVCLLDINMPKMKGYQVAGLIRQQFPEIKIAALTANLDTDSLVNMVKNGATSYLIKSSDPQEWKEAIISLVNRGYFVSEWMATNLLEYIRRQ